MADPEAPAWLSEGARAVWERTQGQLPPGADPDAFAVYCCAVADFVAAQQALDRTGLVIRGQGGGMVRNPFNQLKLANAVAARATAKDLGIGIDPALAEPAPPAHQARYRNQAAVERTITGLRNLGRLEPVDDATVALTRTLADAMDRVDPTTYPAQLASLARAQLASLRMLRGASEDDSDSGLSDIIAALSSPMGDAPES